MGIFSRLNDIINSNLNSMLDRAEDPEKIIRLVIQEMEDTLVEIRSDAARTIADKKKQSRRIDRLSAEVLEWERKAELAIAKGREDLARAALGEKNQLEQTVQLLIQDMEDLEIQLSKLNEDIANLQNKLDDAKARQKTIVMKQSTSNGRLQVREKLHDRRVDDAFSRFEDLERKMENVEGKVESFDLGRSKSLQEEFAELEVQDKIDEELAKLREKVKEK
ncbi:MAG: phage shock protein PspA [Gammaproteobacteria bacterium]|nr:phage shock protein PspA [Gammaproteobacteria bacterium]